ncbi:MAG: YtxH domain-containing protein [Nitrospirota bacterium]|nr:YtxH domain-containing protein [Nitrospirota bacterium]
MNKNTTKIAGAFLLGGLIGASVALLYAPKSGRETREDISKTAKLIKNKSVDLAEEMIETVNDLTNNVKDNINREKSRISLVRLLFP